MLVHTADWHVKAHTWSNRPDIKGDSEFSIKQIVDFCLKTKADLLVAGDIFDVPRPDNVSVRLVQEAFHRLVQEGVQVSYLCGNHDPISWCDTSPELQSGVCHIQLGECDYIFPDGSRLAGFDYIHKSVIEETFSTIPEDVQMIAVHQFFKESGSHGSAQCSLDDVPDHVKLVLAGDIHKKLDYTNELGQRLLYPGSPIPTKISDCGDKGFWLIKSVDDVEHIPIFSRPFIEFESDGTDLDKIVKQVKKLRVEFLKKTKGVADKELLDEVSKPLVKFAFIIDDTPGLDKKLAEKLDGAGFVFPYPVSRQSKAVLEAIQTTDIEELKTATFLTYLKEEVDKDESPELFNVLESFLSGAELFSSLTQLAKDVGLEKNQISNLLPKAKY